MGRQSGKPHPVLQAAAPLVIAPVGPGCPELIDQGMIGGKDFDAVNPCLLGTVGSSHKRDYQFLDLRLADSMTTV